MQNTRLDESQAGIKIAGRSINNLRYADETTLMAESKGELKCLLMRWKSWLEPQHPEKKKKKIMASSPNTSWQIDGEKLKTVTDFTFWGSKITAESDSSHKLKDSCSLDENLWQT